MDLLSIEKSQKRILSSRENLLGAKGGRGGAHMGGGVLISRSRLDTGLELGEVFASEEGKYEPPGVTGLSKGASSIDGGGRCHLSIFGLFVVCAWFLGTGGAWTSLIPGVAHTLTLRV